MYEFVDLFSAFSAGVSFATMLVTAQRKEYGWALFFTFFFIIGFLFALNII